LGKIGGQDKECELFDCEKDPLKLFNVHKQPDYNLVVVELTKELNTLMWEIGDVPVHPIPLPD
jgi:hypothetical protein